MKLIDNIGTYITICTAIVGTILWFSSLNNIARSNQKDIKQLEQESEKIMTTFYKDSNTIDERLSRLEAQLELVAEKVGFDIDRR